MIIINTNLGAITVRLFEKEAPKTTLNFLKYINSGFYDDTIFHRVIDGFMIQGGGFDANMDQKDVNAPISNEAKNGLSNIAGTIAMARTQEPHSATAQFFINVADNHFLDFKSESQQDWGYCVFAEIVDGMDVVNHIEKVKTSNHGHHGDVPVETVFIESIMVD
ncbi:MAG: peptidyl-prolyl cis-trans isomerase B (cyclophilin B) [bacterium]|jgi:peptidyl-prolyl cis-trans isomerase B (cyclophilin B)